MIALFDNLKIHLPFSFLDSESLKLIENNAQIAYYPKDTLLIDENVIPTMFFVIIKGIVEAKDAEELIDIYQNDDVFAGIELIKNQPSKYRYSVNEELICYEISKEVFLELCQKNSEFKNYFFSSMVERIELLKESGAKYIGKGVEVDGKVVTANGPKMAKQFAEEIVKLLEKE